MVTTPASVAPPRTTDAPHAVPRLRPLASMTELTVKPSGTLCRNTAKKISQPKAFDDMVRPVPVNSLGSEVAGLDVTPDLVRVQMRFVAGTGSATKP